jgi:hypothetical protein
MDAFRPHSTWGRQLLRSEYWHVTSHHISMQHQHAAHTTVSTVPHSTLPAAVKPHMWQPLRVRTDGSVFQGAQHVVQTQRQDRVQCKQHTQLCLQGTHSVSINHQAPQHRKEEASWRLEPTSIGTADHARHATIGVSCDTYFWSQGQATTHLQHLQQFAPMQPECVTDSSVGQNEHIPAAQPVAG